MIVYMVNLVMMKYLAAMVMTPSMVVKEMM